MREYPKLDLTGQSTAVAYHFRVNAPLGGWAICTVNDRTGELTVQSDWGCWAHRWNTDHIGRPFSQDDDLLRWIDDVPYEGLATKPSHEYLILTRSILPALIKACAAEVQRRAELEAQVARVAPAAGVQ